jgi:Rha family phage regulatory protein
MNSLVITSKTGKDVTTSLIVAEVFEKRHVDVLRDIRNLHCSDEFRVRNFALLVEMKQLPQGGASKAEYYEITKNGFSFLVMGYNGEKAGEFKENFINEFDKREALLKNDDYILNRAFEISHNRLKALEQQLNQKDEQLQLQEYVIKDQAPKVNYYETVLQSEELIPTNVIAKELGMSAVTLNKLLHRTGIIYRSGDTWVLYHKYQDLGYTKTKTHPFIDDHGIQRTAVHTYWTEKGREFVHSIVKRVKEKRVT